MIIWLNGPFGVGKTTVANLLKSKISGSVIFDPEIFGDFLHENLPRSVCPEDFQDYSVWRQVTYQMIYDLAYQTGRDIIVPMTIYRKEYEEEIIQKLKQNGIKLEHYILLADRESILKRLEKRTEEDNIWAKQHLDTCLSAFVSHQRGQIIDTSQLKAVEVAHIILNKNYK